MTVTNASKVFPWMKNLWEWADRFSISGTDLPRDQDALLALTRLNINCSYLTELPDDIGYLIGLTHLSIDCKNLEYLPNSLGQLAQLEELHLLSDKVNQFPESLVSLIHLHILSIPTRLIDELPMSIIKRYREGGIWIRNKPFTTLYTLSSTKHRLSEFGFFIIEDGWKKEDLVNLRYETGVDFLFGLQTTEKNIEKVDVVDGVVICQPDEIQQVISIYESIILSSRTLYGLDLNDLKIPLWYTKPAKFIQTTAIGNSESDRLQKACRHIVDEVYKNSSFDYVILSFESDRELSIDEYSDLAEPIESKLKDNSEVFYDLRYVKKTDSCWMGIIYVN